MTDLKTATVQGVTALIDKAATEAIAAGVTMPPAMLAAYEAVLGLIEKRSPSYSPTMDKVRQAVGLPIPNRIKETPCPTSRTTQAASASATHSINRPESTTPETTNSSSPPSLDGAGASTLDSPPTS